MTYRVGNHQPQNLYRDGTYIGVMFTAEDAALAVEALNAAAEGFGRWCEQETNDKCYGLEALEAPATPPAEVQEWTALTGDQQAEAVGIVSDSCTCPVPYRSSTSPDPECPVHQGRRARGPKPPPVGEGCICDGSGRTCPRHGTVI